MTGDDITPESTPRRHGETVTEVLDGEAVVYDERQRTLHVLSPTATVIWQHLDGALSIEDLSAALSDAFGAPLEVIRADTLTAVRSFAEQGLLEGSARVADDPVGGDDAAEDPAIDDPSRPPKFLQQPPHG